MFLLLLFLCALPLQLTNCAASALVSEADSDSDWVDDSPAAAASSRGAPEIFPPRAPSESVIVRGRETYRFFSGVALHEVNFACDGRHNAVTFTGARLEGGVVSGEGVFHDLSLAPRLPVGGRDEVLRVDDGGVVTGDICGKRVVVFCAGVVYFRDATFHTTGGVTLVPADGLPTALNYICFRKETHGIGVWGTLNFRAPGMGLFDLGFDEDGVRRLTSLTATTKHMICGFNVP